MTSIREPCVVRHNWPRLTVAIGAEATSAPCTPAVSFITHPRFAQSGGSLQKVNQRRNKHLLPSAIFFAGHATRHKPCSLIDCAAHLLDAIGKCPCSTIAPVHLNLRAIRLNIPL